MMQIVIGTFLSTVFLLLQVQASPLIEMSDDLLSSAASLAIVVVFLGSYAFKNAELTNLPDIQDKMSLEQEHLYVLDQLALTAMMLVGVLGAIVALGVLFVVQLAIEGERLKREARASRMRRLRYLKDDSEVILPKLGRLEDCVMQAYPAGVPPSAPHAGPFHVFLSHNWLVLQGSKRCQGTLLNVFDPLER